MKALRTTNNAVGDAETIWLRLRCDLGVGEVDQTYYHHRDAEYTELLKLLKDSWLLSGLSVRRASVVRFYVS